MSDAETVERVARAIFVKDFPSGSVKGRWDEVSEPMRDDYRTCARAAIAAMPSPTVQEAAKVLLDALGPSDAIDAYIVDLFYDGAPMTALRAIIEQEGE